jgi:small subunit ribosomal protein S17
MRLFQGTVVKTSSNTLSVTVVRKGVHPVYQKTVRYTKKYLVHDQKNVAKVGDVVSFRESRPYSKRKHFALIKVLANN